MGHRFLRPGHPGADGDQTVTTYRTPEDTTSVPHPDPASLRALVLPVRRALVALPMTQGTVVALRCLKDALAAAPVNGDRAVALIDRARSYLP